ncbi:MAG: DUF302 domain-containing protein [Methylovirgula sp.]
MLKSVSELTRMHFESPRSFDAVRTELRRLLGTSRLQEVLDHARAVRNADDFERIIQPLTGESGFMLFLELDHSGWLPLYGITRKAVRLMFGNPLIAITMIRHDIEAALFAPVELLLVENADGEGSTITYDLPSSLMRAETNPKLLEAAQALDAKVATLASTAVGLSG